MHCNRLTGFDAIEHQMAARFATRADGWPVGPEQVTGRGYYCPCRTVQILRCDPPVNGACFVIRHYFPFRRPDLRFRPRYFRTLKRARLAMYDELLAAGGVAPKLPRRTESVDLWSAGGVVALEDSW
ncbi:MAG: hypothetical protein C0500_07860 [Sphingobium sp.]|nr:hypothetical protein [Sphingobium sp.]